MEYLAAFNEARKRAELEAQKRLERELLEEQQPAPDTVAATPEVKETPPQKEREKPVRYYIFDEEEDPYEIKRQEQQLFEKRQRDLLRPGTRAAKVEKKPLLADFEVASKGEAPNRWFADRAILTLGRQPDAGFYAGVGARFSDRMRTQQLHVQVTPYVAFNNFAGKNGHAVIRYTQMKGRLDWYVEAEGNMRHYRKENTLFPPLDSSLYRFSQLNAKAGARFPLSQFSHLMTEASYHQLSRTDQKLLNQQLLNQSDRVLRAGLGFALDKVKERDGFAYEGYAGYASFFSAYSLPQNAFAFHTASLGLRGYKKVYKDIVLAAQLNSAVSFGDRQQQQYLGGIDDWIIPIFFDENNTRDDRENALSTDLMDFSFQNFVTPVRGFWFFARRGSKFAALNTELRIPLSRMWKQALNSNSLFSIEVIPFLDVGSVWTSGVPFSQKNPTDTQIISNGPVTVELQTLKSPFVLGFGSGFRTNFLGYSVRMDLAWGVDDNTLQKPVLSIAMGRNF